METDQSYTYHALKTIASLTAELIHRDSFLPPKPRIDIDLSVERKYTYNGDATVHINGDPLVKIHYLGAGLQHDIRI